MSEEAKKLPFEGVVVLELGERVGAAACGSLLAMAGATVIVAEPAERHRRGKFRTRAVSCAGKRSVVLSRARGEDERLLRHAVSAADVIIISSDMPDGLSEAIAPDAQAIVCDVTALALPAADSGLLCDKLVQAATGIAAMTGFPQGSATLSDAAILELGAGIYAAAAVAAALRVRRIHGGGQRVAASLYGAAINALTTFLPFHFAGNVPPRAGNRHPMAAPWNAYQAADGWLLLCSANDDQWRRLCAAMGQAQMSEGRLARLAERVRNRNEVDAAVQAWVAGRTVDETIAILGQSDIAAGPILTVAQLWNDPNVRHRRMVRELHDPETGETIAVPGPPLPLGRAATAIPARDADRDFVSKLKPRRPASRAAMADARPLDGIRVLEIGQYTTAPLAAKQMAALGAEVIKVEPLQGEASRAWPPHLDGESHFFALNNANKRSLAVDLRSASHRELFAELIGTSDVLVENLKPGSLARLGFSYRELQALNPRLVYCAISGYGADSAYPGRPAFDTVIQAMCGLMDLTRAEGVPTKLGVSIADTTGGMMGLFCTLAMLEARDRSGHGAFIDLAMQDVGLWATHTAWDSNVCSSHAVISCADGEVAAIGAASDVRRCLLAAGLDPSASDRATLVQALLEHGLPAAPVRSIDEVARLEQRKGGFIRLVRAGTRTWPLLELPFQLSRMPDYELKPIGGLGTANAEFAATAG